MNKIKYNQLREEIIKANEDIVDLKFWEKQFDKKFGKDRELLLSTRMIGKKLSDGVEVVHIVCNDVVKEFISKTIQQAKQEKDKEYADFSERMNRALFEAEYYIKQEERERIRVKLDAIVYAYLWGDYGLSTREVYEGCEKLLHELKQEK